MPVHQGGVAVQPAVRLAVEGHAVVVRVVYNTAGVERLQLRVPVDGGVGLEAEVGAGLADDAVEDEHCALGVGGVLFGGRHFLLAQRDVPLRGDPERVLEGRVEVAPHELDDPHEVVLLGRHAAEKMTEE